LPPSLGTLGAFNSSFRFRIAGTDGNPWSIGDGFAFVIQGGDAAAVGAAGNGLGYKGIGNSVAVKFDAVNSAGEGVNSTGLYLNGAAPTTPALSLDAINARQDFVTEYYYDPAFVTLHAVAETLGPVLRGRFEPLQAEQRTAAGRSRVLEDPRLNFGRFRVTLW
jgi:hypothetical protein